ncbi:sensor histidine kinase [Clostridium haemolyticum]|nr:sensor histidine kinase [Clostridium haemolyticum]
MSEGDLNFLIDVKNKGALGELANNINNIKEGYDKAVTNEVKSQRFKSELITNVSHDLKTPLTSIINYVKLLQQEGLSQDEIKGYIRVLDRKAERLKVLIEDLFEASKVSSGAVELNIEKLDVVSLLKQALGEFDEKIQKSSLDFRIKIPDKSIYCQLDGKKTWRLFENLISNVLKYSQENTRVYIDLQEKDNKVIITMKNIASYEMNFEPEEIFERFKRGDESRTTEGSGLGLAIANSIAELQGGKLYINIDGDLFKSIVELKVIK